MGICRLIRGRKVRRQARAIGKALQRSPQSLRVVQSACLRRGATRWLAVVHTFF